MQKAPPLDVSRFFFGLLELFPRRNSSARKKGILSHECEIFNEKTVQVHAVIHAQSAILPTADLAGIPAAHTRARAPNVCLANIETFLARWVGTAAQDASVKIKALNSCGCFI